MGIDMDFRILIIILTFTALVISVVVTQFLPEKKQSRMTYFKSKEFKKVFGITYLVIWVMFFLAAYYFETILI
tara:strand:+ start:1121 stop:1339 length:219 start_codon:yes stop_codon:yes gene_type:complete